MTDTTQKQIGAICKWCGQDMLRVHDCVANRTVEYPDGVILPSLPFEDGDEGDICHDCAVEVGSYHHPGCDVERCPRCGGQLISCDCLDDEDEYLDTDSNE